MPIRSDMMKFALADSGAKGVNSEYSCLLFQCARSLTDQNESTCIEGLKDAEAGATTLDLGGISAVVLKGEAQDVAPPARKKASGGAAASFARSA